MCVTIHDYHFRVFDTIFGFEAVTEDHLARNLRILCSNVVEEPLVCMYMVIMHRLGSTPRCTRHIDVFDAL